jgi:hypothetical protein
MPSDLDYGCNMLCGSNYGRGVDIVPNLALLGLKSKRYMRLKLVINEMRQKQDPGS